jgi:predicted RND superfamily exporter protein
MGIDEMIHLGHRVRQARKPAGDVWAAWKEALADMWQPILASMLIVVSGFALFLLSDSPPTQRLGVLVHWRSVDRHCGAADAARSGDVPSPRDRRRS